MVNSTYAYKLAFELIIYYSLASLTFKVDELCFICQKLYCVENSMKREDNMKILKKIIQILFF